MATMLYSATMSLDGFIAGAGGDLSWINDHAGPNPAVDALVPQIGAVLVGNRTFHGDDPNAGTDKEGAFGGQWSGPTYVVTHHRPEQGPSDVTFVDDLDRAIATAKEAAGEKYVNIIGANLARSCFDAGAVDEVLVFVAPLLLGDGVRLFEYVGGTNVGLEQLSLTQTPQVTSLWFRVIR